MLQCPGLGSPTLEAQAKPLAGTPRHFQLHSMEEKEEKKKKKGADRTPKQMVTVKLNRQNHTKKHTHTLTKRELKKRKIATKPINKPINENKC